MLELIVLGHVPGTRLTITFSQVLCIALAFLMLGLTVHEAKTQETTRDENNS